MCETLGLRIVQLHCRFWSWQILWISAWQRIVKDTSVQKEHKIINFSIVFLLFYRASTLTVPLSTQVYKWVPANCWGNLTNCGGMTCDGLASRPGEVEILLAASFYRNRDKHQQLWVSLGSKASHTHTWHGFSVICNRRFLFTSKKKIFSHWPFKRI